MSGMIITRNRTPWPLPIHYVTRSYNHYGYIYEYLRLSLMIMGIVRLGLVNGSSDYRGMIL